MTFVLHGTTLALAWFFAVNVALSAVVALLAKPAGRSAPLLLRLLPAGGSILFAAFVFVPSYLRFEPREFVEGFDITLMLVAVGAAALLVKTTAAGAAAWWRAASWARRWTRTGEPIALGIGIPAFRVDTAEPVLALVGVVRSRLIVTSGLIDALTPAELAASIAHEVVHHKRWDNLQRLAMRAAPDVLGWTGAARRLERAWAASAEHRADAGSATAADHASRLALASALVKVARLMPRAPALIEPVSTLVGGGDIAVRVGRLLDDAPLVDVRVRRLTSGRLALAAAAAASLALLYAPLLVRVHDATEVLVRSLP